jgi:hypothetical protein
MAESTKTKKVTVYTLQATRSCRVDGAEFPKGSTKKMLKEHYEAEKKKGERTVTDYFSKVKRTAPVSAYVNHFKIVGEDTKEVPVNEDK